MTLDIILTAGEAATEMVAGKSVAVIDVFRATSVITEALRNGAKAVIPVVEIGEARQIAAAFPRGETLLGGERKARKIDGFDKGNSPLSYTPAEVKGKTVVLTTTNGTRAINNCAGAAKIFIASFLNMTAVCRALAGEGRDVTLVCSGREGRYTMEDGLCAGAMAGLLGREYGYRLTDIAFAMRCLHECAGGDIKGSLEDTLHYGFLVRNGYQADIEHCLRRDIYDTVPVCGLNGEIKIQGDGN